MTTTQWHGPAHLLARFAEDPGGLDDASAASIESHVIACAGCRAELTRLVGPALAAASWDTLVDRIDRPRAPLLQRVLQLLGVRSGPARLAAATPGLRLSGLTAVIGLTGLAVTAARHTDASGPFLLIAPLVPLAAVALTFAASPDPAGEAGVATAMHGAGLVLRRSAAVLVVAFFVLGMGAVTMPELGSAPLGWVLPATALAMGSLALGTWVRAELAVAGLALAWLTAAGLVRRIQGLDPPFADSALFTPGGQGVALALTVAAGIVLAARSDRYTTLEVRT